MRLKRRTLAVLSPVLLAALSPARTAADSHKDQSGKGRENRRQEQKREEPKRGAPARPPQVASRPAPQPQAPQPQAPQQRPQAPQPQSPQPVPQAPRPAAPAPRSTSELPTDVYPPVPQGAERMVSDPVQLIGADGTGAGPARLDVEGAHPATFYEVQYVPGSSPAAPVALGRVQTDASGRFEGAAPEPMPALDGPGRTGVFVFRRVS